MMKMHSSPASEYYANRGDYRGPYAEYERLIVSSLHPGVKLLDIGCGRTFPLAGKWLASGASVAGLDPVIDPVKVQVGVECLSGWADQIPCQDGQYDLIVSCAVLEHLEIPQRVFQEFHRVLKPGGRAILLTPSKYDYVSIVASLLPNRFHGKVVNATEGRAEEDTFPTFYRANSRRQLQRLAYETGFVLDRLHYLDQSPYALKFNPILYRIGCGYHSLVRSIKALESLNGWILCVMVKPG